MDGQEVGLGRATQTAGSAPTRRVTPGWSRADLGERVGVSAASVKAWETGAGRRGPTQRRLAQVLGLGVDDLEQPGPADAVDLRHLRESLGWTQAEGGAAAGVERSVLETGRSR